MLALDVGTDEMQFDGHLRLLSSGPSVALVSGHSSSMSWNPSSQRIGFHIFVALVVWCH